MAKEISQLNLALRPKLKVVSDHSSSNGNSGSGSEDSQKPFDRGEYRRSVIEDLRSKGLLKM